MVVNLFVVVNVSLLILSLLLPWIQLQRFPFALQINGKKKKEEKRKGKKREGEKGESGEERESMYS